MQLCQKQPLLLALVLDQTFIYVKGLVAANIRPCHCAGIPIVPAIVRVYQSIKPSHCAGIFKQYNPALLDQNKTDQDNCIRLKPDRFIPNSSQIQVWVRVNIEVYRSRIGSHHSI